MKKKRAVVSLALLLLSLAVFSQRTIKGRVINAANGEAIAGSSVFISNTSRGTVTDRQGNFELTGAPSGKQDLIISSVGYETFAYSYSDAQLPLELKVELKLKVRELENVTIEPSVEEGWDKWGKTFTDNFIGTTPNAASCSIKNQKAIRFRFYRKSNRVIAYSDEPILVENKALGYRIRFQMEDFEVNFKEGSSMFAGYPYFEEMNKGSNLKKKWQKGRAKAYNGSIMQFIRSLYNNNFTADGFEVRRMARVPNLERERVKKLYKSAVVSSGNLLGTVRVSGAQPDKANHDSMDYYQRIMQQKDYIEVYGREPLTADSLIVGTEGDNKILAFQDYLLVTYKKEIEDKEYLAFYREGRKPTFQRSYIWLIHGTPVLIARNGSYYPPQEVFSMAYWGWDEKMANTLPLDYGEELGIGN